MILRTSLKVPALAGALVVLTHAGVGRAQGPGGQNQAPPSGSGLITGQVVDADTGRGIPHAPVALQGVPGPGAGPQGRAGGPMRPFAVLSDSQGRFFFGGLAAGSYVPGTEVLGYMQVAPFRPVVLADGAYVSDARILLRRLSNIVGRVTDDAGTPVVGVLVRAFRRSTIQGRPPSLQPAGQGLARTDDRGEYRVSSLAPDEYLVCACAVDPIPFDGNLLTMLASRPVDLLDVAGRAVTAGAETASLDPALRTFPITFHPNTTMVSQAERVRVAPGEDRTNVDITITAVGGRRVSGRLVGAVSSVTAQMIRLRVDGDLPEAAAITQIPPMLVQPDGRFDFANVPPGQYVLEVTFRPGLRGGGPTGAALGFIGGRGAAANAPPPPPQRGGPGDPSLDPLWAMEPISVGERDLIGLVVPLNRGLVVSGRLVFSGTAPQPNPQMLQRPVIQMQSLEAGMQMRTSGSSIQPDGTFEMRGVLPGRYALSAALTIPGWPTLRSITSQDGELTDAPLNLDAADLTNIVITITDAPATSVEVRAQPAPKDDLDAVWVRVFSADRRHWQEPLAAVRRFRAQRANLLGVVTFGGLPPGDYLVATATDNTTNWMTREMLEKISAQAERFRLSETEKLVVEVRR